METWQVVSVAIATGIAAIFTVMLSGIRELVIVWFKAIIAHINRKNYLGYIHKMAKFLSCFESLKKIEEIQRCVLFTGHNCGGMPSPGKLYTVQSLDGWTMKPGKSDPAEVYNFSMKVDSHYTKMLQEMIEIGHTEQITQDLASEAIIRAYYESEGVLFTSLYYLGLLDDELIYLSVGSYDITAFSRKTQIDLQLVVDRMRNLVSGIE